MFERGVGGTSIDEVRSAAAVSGSQISHYFDGKRDLTRNVIGARRNHVREFHAQPQLGALDSLAALEAWVEATLADVNPVYRKGGAYTARSQRNWSRPTPKSTPISPTATTSGSTCSRAVLPKCVAAAIYGRTPIHATSRSHWLPPTRVARCSLSSPTTPNRCVPRSLQRSIMSVPLRPPASPVDLRRVSRQVEPRSPWTKMGYMAHNIGRTIPIDRSRRNASCPMHCPPRRRWCANDRAARPCARSCWRNSADSTAWSTPTSPNRCPKTVK